MRIYIIRKNNALDYTTEHRNGIKYIRNEGNKILIDNQRIDLEDIYEIGTYIKGYRNIFYSKFNNKL